MAHDEQPNAAGAKKCLLAGTAVSRYCCAIFGIVGACVLLALTLGPIQPLHAERKAQLTSESSSNVARTQSPAYVPEHPGSIVDYSSMAKERGQSVRIATYNLNWGNRQGDQVLDAIAASKADILFLQETTRQSERFLQSRLQFSYPYFHAEGHDGRFAAERFAFASKVPLRDVVFAPPDKGLFGFYSASCALGGTRVTLINVHFTPFVIQRGFSVGEMLAALNSTEAKHAAEIEAVSERIGVGRPAIVSGDFNSLSQFAAPTRLRELGLIDSFAATHDDADSHPTWYWPTSPLPLSLRIDYIFHTRHFHSVHSEVIKRQGSDHSLVVSELRLVEQDDAEEPPIVRSGSPAQHRLAR